MKGKFQFARTILENRATKKVRNYHSKGNKSASESSRYTPAKQLRRFFNPV
jgi:hypothetical protein